MSTTDKSEVFGSFDQLREDDAEFAKLSARFAPLADFLVEYEFLKGIRGITQQELAERMGTTQSAVSRFESMKHPPSYDVLIKAAQALGDRLFLSPAASVSMSLPYDLRDIAVQVAERRGMPVVDLMTALLRESLNRERMRLEGATITTTVCMNFPKTSIKVQQISGIGGDEGHNETWKSLAMGEIAV